MSNAFKLSILTPEKEVYRGEITELNTESQDGQIGILANHIPLITPIRPTVTNFVEENGNKIKLFTSSGVLKVAEDSVQMLCDAAEWPKDIDVERARESQKRAEMRIAGKEEGIDVSRAEMALARSLARIEAKGV